MRCSKAKRYLEKYLDGELDPHLQAKLNAHLDVCAQCKSWLVDAKKMQLMLTALPMADFPSWVHNQIMDKVDRLDSQNPGFFRRYKLAPVTAMLTIALSLLIGIKVGTVSYKNIVPEKQDYTISTSVAYGGFGENTILDYVSENGEQDE